MWLFYVKVRRVEEEQSCNRSSAVCQTQRVLNFYKYSNPQMRNGYSISTEKEITMENSRGALLGRQRAKSVTIKKLTTVKAIKDYKEYGYVKKSREAYLRSDNYNNIEYKTLLN